MTHRRPLPFVLAATDHGPMIVNRLDYHQLPSGATYGVGHQLLTNGAYDPGEIAEVLSILRDSRTRSGYPVVALDCGANIGVHTIEMAKVMTGWGRVIAIEPQAMIYYALCGNVALANCFNVEAINAAIGGGQNQIEIPQPNYSKPASFGSLELQRRPSTEYIGQTVSYASKDCTTVWMRTIDSLCDELPHVDFIKLDVEGMEMEALVGASLTLDRCHPTLLVEWIKSDRQALENFLRDFGYEISERGANLLVRK